MTITEQALADLLLNYFTTLEPVAQDAIVKNEMKKVAQPDGSTKIQMVPTKGDVYLPKDLSNAMSKAIAKAIWPQLGGIKIYRKTTTSLTVSGTLSPSAPTFISAIEVEIDANEGDFVQIHVGTHDVQQDATFALSAYLGFTFDDVDTKNVHIFMPASATAAIGAPLSVTWTIGPLTKGSHYIKPYAAKYQASDHDFSCRWPFCHVLAFPGVGA